MEARIFSLRDLIHIFQGILITLKLVMLKRNLGLFI